jgi:hypothetical protein
MAEMAIGGAKDYDGVGLGLDFESQKILLGEVESLT